MLKRDGLFFKLLQNILAYLFSCNIIFWFQGGKIIFRNELTGE